MGSFAEELKWLHFLALACSAISEVNNYMHNHQA